MSTPYSPLLRRARFFPFQCQMGHDECHFNKSTTTLQKQLTCSVLRIRKKAPYLELVPGRGSGPRWLKAPPKEVPHFCPGLRIEGRRSSGGSLGPSPFQAYRESKLRWKFARSESFRFHRHEKCSGMRTSIRRYPGPVSPAPPANAAP